MEQQGFLTIFQYKYITLTHNDDAPAAELMMMMMLKHTKKNVIFHLRVRT